MFPEIKADDVDMDDDDAQERYTINSWPSLQVIVRPQAKTKKEDLSSLQREATSQHARSFFR